MSELQKRCTKCLTFKAVSEFYTDGSRAKPRVRHCCKQCDLAASRKYKYANPDKILAHSRGRSRQEYQRNYFRDWGAKRRAMIREIISTAKDVPCKDCENHFPTCAMQFDHVRGVKEFTLAAATGQCKSIEKLMDEIAKCDVVCANCHAIRSHITRVHPKLRRWRTNPQISFIQPSTE